MNTIYQDILYAKANKIKLLAILLDPDKLEVDTIQKLVSKILTSPATHIFVGGSVVENGKTARIVSEIKRHTTLPIVLFPGNKNQITNTADGILFLSLISGRNPEFLIEQQVQSAGILKNTTLEILPTGYILIDGGVETAVQKVSNTKPIKKDNIELVVHTALAGQYSGKKLIYLEAGSGAVLPVATKMIKTVASAITIPIIVGGGIRSKHQIDSAHQAGAHLVVIGTVFEEDISFFER